MTVCTVPAATTAFVHTQEPSEEPPHSASRNATLAQSKKAATSSYRWRGVPRMGSCRWGVVVGSGGACGLPDRPAIDSIISDPFVQPGEQLIDRTARRELDNKEGDDKNSEQLHWDK